ncbi:hypothetical protein LD85_0879 [Saccharolobus islandicus L.D.8.5]|uniref:Uncharacterized protein n=1 Tax=Saccharolobus islandicus (strain L.D.8.5 / Lassen \|nr:hypothetical protein LD85_0879 [Sulfolobus islandicus L.D.8.5]
MFATYAAFNSIVDYPGSNSSSCTVLLFLFQFYSRLSSEIRVNPTENVRNFQFYSRLS